MMYRLNIPTHHLLNSGQRKCPFNTRGQHWTTEEPELISFTELPGADDTSHPQVREPSPRTHLFYGIKTLEKMEVYHGLSHVW